MKKILFLADRFYPSTEVQLEVVYSQLIQQHKYSVVFIMRCRENKKLFEVKRYNSSIVIAVKSPRRDNLFTRQIINVTLLGYMIPIAIRLKPDIIQVRNWTWGLFMGIIIRFLNKIPLVFQYTYPRDYTLQQKAQQGKIASRIRSFCELFWLNYFIRYPDAILPISNTMKKALIAQGIKTKIIYPLGMGYNSIIDIKSKESDRIKNDLQIINNDIVMYFGTMDEGRKLEFLMNVWKDVLTFVDNNLILVLTGGELSNIERLSKYADKLNISNRVLFTGFLKNRKDVYRLLKTALYSVSPIPPTPMYNVSSPTKLYESLGLGCPVIGNDLPEQGAVLRKSKGGICVKYDKDQFVKAMTYLANNKAHSKKLGNQGKDYVLKNRSYEHITHDLVKIYNNHVLP